MESEKYGIHANAMRASGLEVFYALGLLNYGVWPFGDAGSLVGLAFIAVGVFFKVDIDSFTASFDDKVKHLSLAPILLIVLGCIVFMIAFFGCCGAIKESSCMLTTYAVILLTLFILQVAVGVYVFIQFKDSDKSDIKDEIHIELNETLSLYLTDATAREVMDDLQADLECCGVDDPDDWKPIFRNGSVPLSCCKSHPADVCYPDEGDAFIKGCFIPFWELLQSITTAIGITVIVIGACEIVGAIVSLCLSSSIRNNERRGNYA